MNQLVLLLGANIAGWAPWFIKPSPELAMHCAEVAYLLGFLALAIWWRKD